MSTELVWPIEVGHHGTLWWEQKFLFLQGRGLAGSTGFGLVACRDMCMWPMDLASCEPPAISGASVCPASSSSPSDWSHTVGTQKWRAQRMDTTTGECRQRGSFFKCQSDTSPQLLPLLGSRSPPDTMKVTLQTAVPRKREDSIALCTSSPRRSHVTVTPRRNR